MNNRPYSFSLLSICILLGAMTGMNSLHAQEAGKMPKFSGELWTGVFYQDRYDQQWMKLQVTRALLRVDYNVESNWDVSFSFIGSSEGGARMNHAYLQHRGLLGEGSLVQMGRVKMPYFIFMEKTLSHRWAELRSQAEDRGFVYRRTEAVSLIAPIFSGSEIAFSVYNGAEDQFKSVDSASDQNTDADLAYVLALGLSLSDTWRLNSALDYAARSEPLTKVASLASVTSLGYRSVSTALLAEINYLLSIFKTSDNKTYLGYSLTGQYSFEDTLDSPTDMGMLLSFRSGNKAHREKNAEAVRFSIGPYFQVGKRVRTAFQGFYYQGVDSIVNSDGYQLRWSWEARF